MILDKVKYSSLNNLWRQKNKPTNVLAFPCGDMENDYVLLGDIANTKYKLLFLVPQTSRLFTSIMESELVI